MTPTTGAIIASGPHDLKIGEVPSSAALTAI